MLRLLFIASALFVSAAQANGISPYLPLKLSPEVEFHIEKLMALTPESPLIRPYKAADVQRQAELIKDTHPLLYSQISQYLERFKQKYAVTHLSASVSGSDGATKAIPNQRNVKTDSSYQVSIGGLAYFSPYSYVSVGETYEDEQGLIHTNTHLAFGYEYAQVELGYREHWYSPFQDSAMLVSTHAISSPSITVSNATPITSWNIRYEVFYSKLEYVEGIVLGDEVFPGEPSQVGIHISASPWDFWTIGLNRTMMFGGGKREVDFWDVMQAIFNPAYKDNVGDANSDDPNFEFGNQQASVSTRFHFNWFTPISLYGEIAGEDTVDESNFKLGNQAISAGIFLPALTDNLTFRYEYSDWTTAWYVHHLYQNGYTNDGQVMGHWGGGERDLQRDTPATTHSVNMTWQVASNQLLDLTLRTIENEDKRAFDYERGYEGNLRYSYATKKGFWGVELYSGKDVYGDTFNRLSAFYRW